MNAERLIALYEQVAEAPDAVSRLRRFVLDLAVRGKLVAQDPADEPASELLKRIAAEKARLVKAGEIRKPRDLASGEDLQSPFNIPATWRWCRLDTVGAIIGGGTPSAGDPENFAEPGDGIPWLTPADLGGYHDLHIERGARDLTEKGLASSSVTMMPAGTVLFTSRAPIGYVAIAANPISTNQGFKSVVPYIADCSRFIALAMQTFAPEIDAKAPGTTFKEVSGKIVAGVPFPLPPLAEQRRIVAKVEELMALMDRLEAARTAREATRDRLTAASLARLTASDADPAEFPANARFALATLPALTTRPDQIKPLRQTILNLAVRGKLVEQDLGDETVSSAVEIIRSDMRGTKKQSAKPDMTLVDFSIPSHWVWQSLDAILTYGPQNGLSPRKSERTDAPKAITLTATTSGKFDDRQFKHVEVSFSEAAHYWLEPGDLLFQRGNTREYVGMAAIYDGPREEFLFPDLIMRVKTSPHVNIRFVHLWCIAPFARNFLGSNATGAQQTMPKINQGILRSLPVALPPLAEQHRIVAKVDALMALCDRLEAALATADTTRARLLEALLHEALDAGARKLEAAE